MNKIFKIIYIARENLFAYSLSIIIHLILLSFLLYNIDNIKNAMSSNIRKEENREDAIEIDFDNYLILVDPIDIPEEEDYKPEPTRFASDRNIQSQGEPEFMPNLLPQTFKPFIEERQETQQTENEGMVKQQEESAIAKLQESSDGEIEIYRPLGSDASMSDKKVPSTFDEAADRAIIFSSETGKMRLGTQALPYYWYFKGLVSSISKMWGYTIPNQAHFLGLIRSDEVEILLSIDENGKVEFVRFLRQSRLGQNSLNNSCQKAIEYTGNIGIPPSGLFEQYQENGKIYIPFRFIYQNVGGN